MIYFQERLLFACPSSSYNSGTQISTMTWTTVHELLVE